MHYDLREQNQVPASGSVERAAGLTFDSENVVLDGLYTDELSAFRAKRAWTEIFETNFLLESGHDYLLGVASSVETQRFVLRCSFTTACGRYAFWRLINDQAPEIEYLLETAHVPNLEYRLHRLMEYEEAGQELFRVSEHSHEPARYGWGDLVREVVSEIKRRFRR